jgi:hypothetical protein
MFYCTKSWCSLVEFLNYNIFVKKVLDDLKNVIVDFKNLIKN